MLTSHRRRWVLAAAFAGVIGQWLIADGTWLWTLFVAVLYGRVAVGSRVARWLLLVWNAYIVAAGTSALLVRTFTDDDLGSIPLRGVALIAVALLCLSVPAVRRPDDGRATGERVGPKPESTQGASATVSS